MLLGIGIPLLFLEMAVGQRAQQSSADMWKNLSPWFGGVGYSMVMVLFVLLLVPYSIIVCFLIRTLSMDGAEYGLKHLLILKVASISDLTIWCHAGIQVLFDIGLGFGPIVSLASHVPDFNNCMADAFLMALFKIITLLMTTPFLLSILGFWATTTTHHCCKKNQEKLLRLVAQGILPPDAQPPDLSVNPTSSYTSWLSSLPPPLRSAVLSVVPECSVQKQFLKSKEVVRVFPEWSKILIAGLTVFVLMPIPAYFVYCLTLGIPFRSAPSSKLPLGSGQLQSTKEASKDILQDYKTES